MSQSQHVPRTIFISQKMPQKQNVCHEKVRFPQNHQIFRVYYNKCAEKQTRSFNESVFAPSFHHALPFSIHSKTCCWLASRGFLLPFLGKITGDSSSIQRLSWPPVVIHQKIIQWWNWTDITEKGQLQLKGGNV